MLRPSEVLTADEAAEIFAAYAATDGVAEPYVLRELDLRWPPPGDEESDASEQHELITVELWREDAHPGDQGERTATFEVPARLPLSAVLARVIEPFLADAPRTGWVCRGKSRGEWRDFAEVVTFGAPNRLGSCLLVRNHSIRSFVGAAEGTFRVVCNATVRSRDGEGSGRARLASQRPLLFSDGEDDEQRWAPGDALSAQAAFWAFVRERQPDGTLTFGIEDEEHGEGIMLLLGADAIGRATTDPVSVDLRAVPEFGDYFALVSTFVSGGITALERHGPWLPDQQALVGAQLRMAMDESRLRRTHPRELRHRLAVLTRIGGREPVIVDGVTHYGYAHDDGSTVDAWFTADGRGLLVTNDRTSPLSASAVDAAGVQPEVPAAVLALAGSAPATGVFTFAGPCALADGLVPVLREAELGLAATGVERLVDPFLEIESFTQEAVVAAALWWSADDVGRGFAAAAASEAVLDDAASLDGAAVGVLRRAWAVTGFFDRWDVHWVLFDSCTLGQAGEARGALLQAVEALGLELVDSPPGSADGEVWVRTDPRIGLGAAGAHPDVAPPLDPVSEPQSCATCDSALVRSDGKPPYDIDIDATTQALQDRVAAGRMRAIVGDVPLADMIDLFASDMKYTIVSFLECLDCTRLLEWGLAIRGAAIFKHVDPAVLDRMRWSEVPPRLAWAGAASFASMDADGKARERRAGIARHLELMRGMHEDAPAEVVEVQPGEWVLLHSGHDLLLATKRSGSEQENSLLLRLDATETAGFRRDGTGYLDQLASRIQHDPSASGGAFDSRDLYRGRGGPRYRALAAEATRAWRVTQPRLGACEICSSYWVTHVGGPVTIGESERLMGEVRRCRSCGAYWEVGAFSFPQVISREEAQQGLPDLARLEAQLGGDFPEPPPLPPGAVR
nr:DUF6357 family protein [Agrococcus sp. KRD186]